MSLIRNRDARIDNTAQHIAQLNLVINEADNYTIAVTGTGEQQIVPPTNYILVTGYNAASTYGTLLTAVNGEAVVGTLPPGKYFIEGLGYLDPSHDSNQSTVGVVFGLTRAGVTTLTPRTVHARVPNIDQIGNLAGNGTIMDVQSGDKIGVYLASDNTGIVDIHTSNVRFALYKEI